MSGAVAVIGAGGHGKVVVSTLRAAGVEISGVFDQDSSRRGASLLGVEVRGGLDELERLGCERAVLAIGDNRDRFELASALAELELDWVTVSHPSAVVDPSVTLGPGCVVFAGAVLQPDTRVGKHSIVNTCASADHDCRLGDFVHLAPGARLAGGVRVGSGALVGIGAAVVPGREVGDWAVVGAGATVVHDVTNHSTVKGVPAR